MKCIVVLEAHRNFHGIENFFPEQIGRKTPAPHHKFYLTQPMLRASIDLALCRIRMRAPCNAMSNAVQIR
jgi:hypothetical protein